MRIDIYEDEGGLRWRAGQYGFSFVPVTAEEAEKLALLAPGSEEEQALLRAMTQLRVEDC